MCRCKLDIVSTQRTLLAVRRFSADSFMPGDLKLYFNVSQLRCEVPAL